ncbi:hypothetical protein FKM82_024186 [Ascaphus truei]
MCKHRSCDRFVWDVPFPMSVILGRCLSLCSPSVFSRLQCNPTVQKAQRGGNGLKTNIYLTNSIKNLHIKLILATTTLLGFTMLQASHLLPCPVIAAGTQLFRKVRWPPSLKIAL